MEKPLRVLLVEDSEDDALLMIRELKKGGYEPEYERVETAEAMSDALRKKTWDAILCDYNLPGFSGLKAITLMKERDIDLPLIIVSGAIGEETAVEAMRSGAHDYVMKGNLSRLVPAIERELKEAESRLQRRQAEEALKQQISFLQILIDTIPSPIFFKNAEGRYQGCNSAFESFIGLSKADIIGKTVYDISPSDLSAVCQKSDLALLSKPDVQQYESSVKYADGTRHEVIFNKATFLDIAGKIAGLVGVMMDITERKRAEELYKTLAESSLSAVFIVQDGKFRFINTGAIAYAGYSAEELVGKPADTIVHPEDRETVKKKGREMLQGKDTTPFEFRMVTKQGEIRWILQIVSPIEYEGKGALLGNAIDITGIKQANEYRIQSFERLRKALGATVHAMSVAVEMRDPYTAGHQRRVADLACAIATEMGIESHQIDGLRMAGVIHDIGKMSIPAEILSKPTRLSEIEFQLIKTHSQSGYNILKDIEFPWPIARIVLEHHERLNGSGYPNGLTGENLLMESKILAVADVMEAIASHRPYRVGMGVDAALDEIMNNRTILYDAAAVDVCLWLFKEKEYRFE